MPGKRLNPFGRKARIDALAATADPDRGRGASDAEQQRVAAREQAAPVVPDAGDTGVAAVGGSADLADAGTLDAGTLTLAESPGAASAGGTGTAVRVPTVPTVREAGQVDDDRGVSLLQGAWRRLRRNPVFLLGAAITAVFLLVAALAPLLAPHDPTKGLMLDQITVRDPIPPASAEFPLGGDNAGRDLLSRLIIGSQQTLLVGVVATLGGLLGGVLLGTLAGAFGGWVDALTMRVVDVMLSIPTILLAFSIAALFAKPSQWTVILAIAVIQIPVFARLLRGTMLVQRQSDHVLAARALGIRRPQIVLRHMLPNALGPVIVQATLVLATAILDAAALSYLGLGNPDDSTPEWGQMLGSAQEFIESNPHLAIYPAVCIIVVALGFTLMGESLREALDPKSRR